MFFEKEFGAIRDGADFFLYLVKDLGQFMGLLFHEPLKVLGEKISWLEASDGDSGNFCNTRCRLFNRI